MRQKLIVLVLAVVLVVSLVIAGCAKPEQPAPAPSPAPAPAPSPAPALTPAELEGKFTVLNPEGVLGEIDAHGLSPRIDTLEGKTVNVINLHGGPEAVIEDVAPALQEAVPGCNVVYMRPVGGFAAPKLSKDEWAQVTDCDAAIIGYGH